MFYSYEETTTTTRRVPGSKPEPTTRPRKISFNGQEPEQSQEPQEPQVSEPTPVTEPAEPSVPAQSPVPAGPTEAETVLANELKRINAEYANYRKRVKRDSETVGTAAVIGVMEKMLPVLDDIVAARKYGDLAEGPFASISTKLAGILGDLGLKSLGAEGEEFNPEIHEALLRQPHADIPEDHIAMVLREGYQSGDRVIRAAQVIVSAGA